MNDKTIDVETVKEPTLAVAIRQEAGAVAPSGLFGTQEPVAIIEKATSVATALKDVIIKQGLISRISGKEYAKCEAWTLLGTMLGVFPVLCWSRPVEGGWEARVEAKTRDGAVVGAAEAQCLRAERNWANRDDFALRSMAQTRATSKCLRMPLGFVMSLSGFEVTPAEEMVSDHPHQPAQNTPPRAPAPRPAPAASQPVNPRPAPKPAPAPAPEPGKAITMPFPTETSRAKMIAALKAGPGEPNRAICTEFFRKVPGYGPDSPQLAPFEELEQLRLAWVPATVNQMKMLSEKLAEFGDGGQVSAPFPPHPDPAGTTRQSKKEAEPSKETVDHSGLEQITGVIQHVSQKQGSGNKGPWVLYGIKICDGWINTFSDRIGSLAQEHQGKKVTVWYKTEEKGRLAYDLEVA